MRTLFALVLLVADIKFDISDLEKSKDEITDMILAYKGSTSILFAGHKE